MYNHAFLRQHPLPRSLFSCVPMILYFAYKISNLDVFSLQYIKQIPEQMYAKCKIHTCAKLLYLMLSVCSAGVTWLRWKINGKICSLLSQISHCWIRGWSRHFINLSDDTTTGSPLIHCDWRLVVHNKLYLLITMFQN